MATKVRLTMRGTRHLLMNNVQKASSLNTISQQMSVLSKKRIKTDEDRAALARLDWEGGLYFDDGFGPYLPVQNVFTCLIEGARLTKAGKKIERGVNIDEALGFPLVYKGPRTVDALWEQRAEFADCRPVVVGRAKVDRWRPRFREWAIEAEMTLDGSVIELDEFTRVAESTGAMIGIGDYRRFFGRFETAVEEV
jgi:hypothetical protein